jgi:hypothetical protein
LLESGVTRVCDVGGGAHPVVELPRIRRLRLEYTVFDLSPGQLDRAGSGYETWSGNVLDRGDVAELVRSRGPFDLALSRWTAEHMSDGRLFHENVYAMLRPGGTAIHLFPTLYSLPFVVNHVLSTDLSERLLFWAFPRRHTKFPTHYSWCRGPTHRQITRLESIGYELVRYTGFFGHDFYRKLGPLHHANGLLAATLTKHPLPSLTSFSLVVLRRPAG